MFATLLSVSLFIALVHPVFAQSGFAINTTTLVQCQQTQISWPSTGNSPYDVLVVPADDVCGEALNDLGFVNNTEAFWTVNIAAGTQVVVSVVDSTGNEAWSGALTVGDSSNSSCLTNATSSAVSGTTLTSRGTATATSSSPTSSAFDPAGAANAGLLSAGILSACPLSGVTLFSSVVLAFITSSL